MWAKKGALANATNQLADVTRPILSVARLPEGGHAVRFTKEGGTITHKESGKILGRQSKITWHVHPDEEAIKACTITMG